jgi:hypothetical protein
VFLGGFAGAVEGAFPDMGGVLLDACERIERGPRTRAVAAGFDPRAHDTVEDQREEERLKLTQFWSAPLRVDRSDRLN